MNKRYIDFPAAAFNPARVILQADPDTGELFKTNIPESGGSSVAIWIAGCDLGGTPGINRQSGPIISYSFTRINTGEYLLELNDTPVDSTWVIAFSTASSSGNLVFVTWSETSRTSRTFKTFDQSFNPIDEFSNLVITIQQGL